MPENGGFLLAKGASSKMQGHLRFLAEHSKHIPPKIGFPFDRIYNSFPKPGN